MSEVVRRLSEDGGDRKFGRHLILYKEVVSARSFSSQLDLSAALGVGHSLLSLGCSDAGIRTANCPADFSLSWGSVTELCHRE